MKFAVLAALALGLLSLPAAAQAPAQPSSAPLRHNTERSRPAHADEPTQSVVFDASGMGSPIKLDRNWKVGIAPGIDAARPDFDDSKWPTRAAAAVISDVSDAGSDEDDSSDQSGAKPASVAKENRRRERADPRGKKERTFAWFRIHVQLPAHHGPLAVLMRLPVVRQTQITLGPEAVAMDLFANGRQVTPEGINANSPEAYQQISRTYPIDIPDDVQDLTIAVRVPYFAIGLEAYTAFFSSRTFILGERSDLNDHLDLWRHAVLFERLPGLVDAGLKMMLALFLLALFWTQRDHPEYLWLGLHLILVAPLAYLDFIGSSGQLEKFAMAALVIQLLLISAYFYFEFLVAFLSLRRRWYIVALRYSAPLLLTVGPLIYFVRQGTAVVICLAVSAVFLALWIFAWGLFTGITLIVAALRRNYEAALLLVPLLLSLVGMLELLSTSGPSSWMGAPVQSALTFQAGPVPIHFSAIADFAGVFVIILIVFVRFLRIHRERERAASELAAARSVQELMIPREAPKTPGYSVDTVYNPANEVGGDFFHIEPTMEGGVLVIIGDVAGHGLQAAMNVSMLMGALRRSPLTEPGIILTALNQVLVGSSSLTTCLAAHFSSNGGVVLASAGHPPPYLNSQEVTLPGGLPLGVMPNVVYEETHLYLHPGDRLLMMSDGVAEARRPNGELFGFDRVHNLSNQSAFFIADAAKSFGQEDDITVLTVRRLAQAMAA